MVPAMTRPYRLLLSLLAALASLPLAACDSSGPPSATSASRELPRLGADIAQTSVSGISSGAYMAGQMHLAHARRIVGAAIIAGGPWGCAESAFADLAGSGATTLNAMKAVNGCMLNLMAMWGVPDAAALARRAAEFAERGLVDPIDTVVRGRVYLFSGQEDGIVRPPIVAAAADFYRRLGMAPGNLKIVTHLPAGHAFIVEDGAGACSRTEKPFIADCDYDQAGSLLSHIYGGLSPHADRAEGSFVVFDQQPFAAPSGTGTQLASEGIVYIPKACRDGSGCRVHVAFHGCAQSRREVGDAFVLGSGFARWADTNRLVILFPQIEAGSGNPQGCWDWWGYTGRDFLSRKAPQIATVWRMVERLATTR